MRYNNTSIFLFLVFVFTACQETNKPNLKDEISSVATLDTVSLEAIELRANEGLFYYNEKVYSGIAIEYYENGIPSKSIQFLNGKRDGYYQLWYENGIKSYESNYKHNKQHGIARSWWSEGTLRSESNFEDGKAHGYQSQWYKSGALFKKRHLVYGKEEGIQQAWRENGVLYINYEAKNGRNYGLQSAGLCYELDDENIEYED